MARLSPYSCLSTGPPAVAGLIPQDAWAHVEYLLQRPFQNVAEWLRSRRRRVAPQVYRAAHQPTEGLKVAWAAFRDAHRHAAQSDIEAERKALCARFQEDKSAGLIQSAKRRRGSRPKT